MADQTQDEYQNVSFYKKHSKPKKAGFSKFQVGDSYYFCRYVDGEIAMLSQAYTGIPGRDNGIESVKKNEKIAKRYNFGRRGKAGHGFALKAGNGQEIAISPGYTSLGQAQGIASRLSGSSFGGKSTSAPKPKKPAARKRVARKSKPRKIAPEAKSFTARDRRVGNYKPLAFYKKNGSGAEGFNSFEKNGAHYFHYIQNGKIILISEAYTSKQGRDNGLSSVMKNMGLKSAYKYRQHKNGKHYFDLLAGNRQEIATSRWYGSGKAANTGAATLRGERTAPKRKPAKRKAKTTRTKAASAKPAAKRSSSEEQNYMPVAFYRKNTKGKKKGFEKFKGPDGEYYFTFYENSKLALISEGYPTAAIRDKGQASVQKNMKIEKRYVYGKGAEGKPGFIIRAGNHKEVARSVGYGSAAAATVGAAYLLGKRRRVAVKKTVAKAPAVKKVTAKKPVVKKVVAAKPRPKPKPKPKAKRKAKPSAAPLAAGAVAAAGLAAKSAAKKTAVKKAAVPVKAAPIKAAPIAAPTPVAPVAAATAAVKAPAVAAAAAAPVEAAVTGGSGIWGWLKWLLLALLALLAALFLMKNCAGGTKDVAVPPPAVTKTVAPAATVDCWNGSEAKDQASCPAKITCWDNSFATSEAACPVKPEPKPEPAPEPKPAPVAAPKMSAPTIAGRICGPSNNALFNVTRATPKTVTRLGTYPEFGNSLDLSPRQFFEKLQRRYNTNAYDKNYLDFLAESLGHGSFANMDASMFTDETLAQGTSGLLGLGEQHHLEFSTFNMTDPRHLEAFRVRSANGTDIHFMKRCGNYMYVCQP